VFSLRRHAKNVLTIYDVFEILTEAVFGRAVKQKFPAKALVRLKVKVVSLHAMEALGGIGGIAPTLS
jgi:hypothetical protein